LVKSRELSLKMEIR